MRDDFKLQPQHYYVVIAVLSFFVAIFCIDAYNSYTYESPVPSMEEIIYEEGKCLPGSMEEWSNPTNEDGSRIWLYEETDNCEVNI